MQYFALFGLPESFGIDRRALESAYRSVQTQTHPDKFGTASAEEKRRAEQQSALVNDAYETLKDPVLRAAYLVKNVSGIDPFHERNTQMPVAFLMEQIELREQIEHSCAVGNGEALERISDALATRSAALEAQLARQLDEQRSYEASIESVRQLRFLQKVASEVDEALARMDA